VEQLGRCHEVRVRFEVRLAELTEQQALGLDLGRVRCPWRRGHV